MYLIRTSEEDKAISHYENKIKWLHGAEPKIEHNQYLTKKCDTESLLFRFNIKLYTNHFAHLKKQRYVKIHF